MFIITYVAGNFLFQLSFAFSLFQIHYYNKKTKEKQNLTEIKKLTATHTLMLPFLGRATYFLGVPTGVLTPVELTFSVDIVFVVSSVGCTVGVEEETKKTWRNDALPKTLQDTKRACDTAV